MAATAAILDSACFKCVGKIMLHSRTEMLSDKDQGYQSGATKMAQAEGLRHLNFSIYFQNIKLAKVKRTFLRKYISI
jgi:hypothetical protein